MPYLTDPFNLKERVVPRFSFLLQWLSCQILNEKNKESCVTEDKIIMEIVWFTSERFSPNDDRDYNHPGRKY